MFLGVLILAFAGWAWRLHAACGFEQLMDAIDTGDLTQVRSLLATSDPAIVNHARGEGGGRAAAINPGAGTFPLLIAVQHRQLEIVRLLLERGADVKRLNEYREEPAPLRRRPGHDLDEDAAGCGHARGRPLARRRRAMSWRSPRATSHRSSCSSSVAAP